MTTPSIEQQLSGLEAQFNAVSAAIINGDPDKVLAGCAALQEQAVSLLPHADILRDTAPADARLAVRLQALSQGVALVRESLARRSAYVQRALELVVPGGGGAAATYSGTAGAVGMAGAVGPYGGPVRQSGQFKVLSA